MDSLTENPLNHLPTPFVEQPGKGESLHPQTIDLDLTQVDVGLSTVERQAKTHPHLLLLLPWLVMGGAERFTLNLIDQLSRRGWQFSIVTTAPSENSWQAEFEKRTPDIFHLPNFLPVKDFPSFLRNFIQSRQFDAMFVQGSIEGYRLLPTLRAFFPALPVFDYLHFVTPDWMDGGFPRLSLLYREAIDLTITSCSQVKDWMIAEGADAGRLRVCPINVDPEQWRPDAVARRRMRAQLEISEDEVVLLYPARLEAQKQPMVFIETVRLLAEEGVPFRALVAGDGSERGLLEEKRQAYQLTDKVRLLGAVAAEKMVELMAAADILFLPSQNEGISQAIYEGMACGLVTVGADVGGQAELITPECGILLLPSSPEEAPPAYAAALRALIQDPSLRQKMGLAARNRITAGFTLDHMGAGIQRILAEGLDLHQSADYRPRSLPSEELRQREARHVVEFLQARQEARRLRRELHSLSDECRVISENYTALSEKYFVLLQPRPASHWFYLWLRQVTLPLYSWLQQSVLNRPAVKIKNRLKSTWTKDKADE